MVQLVKHDLEFILQQIEIAEAHAAGGDLAQLVAGYNGNDGLTQAHLLPYGLRTVDGSYNNLIPGREMWGASGQSFPDLSDPNYINDADGDVFAPGGPPITNNNYGNTGSVADADPRIISNLVVDQTAGNPAAIMAALQHAGVAGSELMSALSEITTIHKSIKTELAAANAAVLLTESNAATAEVVANSTQLAGDVAAAAAAREVADAAVAHFETVRAPLQDALAAHGVEMEGITIVLPNVSPDDGLSSPYNGWMTIFGQFFDHGLDLVAKGGNGTVYVPLQPDDPLYVPGSSTNFMALTRITVDAGPDGTLGTADDVSQGKNMTTPWVDQNQTYGSTASKQIFMREYIAGPDGKPIATGHLLEGSAGGPNGTKGGLATWADIKAQAREMLGINLTNADVGNIPLLASDDYGNFVRGPNGYPQIVVGLGGDGLLGTADDVLLEGDPTANGGLGVNLPPTTIRTGHAFLDDIAHNAAPGTAFDLDNDPMTRGDNATPVQADDDDIAGNAIATDYQGRKVAYDDELLDAHYIAGDGRVNENIALTAVHHVFHSEHNRLVEHTKMVALESKDLDFINEWLLTDLTAPQFAIVQTGDAAAIAELAETLVWNGERLFQAARFTTEMEYQHLVFEEFGRMMQPDIDAFVFEPSADINPNIAAEFAHVVYRFGHSMLREDIARISLDENGNPVQDDVSLFSGFLNPIEFASAGDADAAAGAIIRGMTRQTGSEIDEFVTDVLRNQLLGVPLDLASINIARGRDVGTPSLNMAREKFFLGTGGDTLLKPYTSWADYALNLKNPASIINFIAAYGTHEELLKTDVDTIEEKRDVATALVLGGSATINAGTPSERIFTAGDDRFDFLNATGAYAGGSLGGLNNVDFWVGGLAEKKMSFGGMLGSTFSFVFQMTMENLQDADRFYYLSRTQGLNLLNELENNTFAELVMRNTDLGDPDSTALPGNVFSAFAMPTLEMDISKQIGADPVHDDPILQAFSRLVERRDANGNLINDTVTDAAYIRVNSNEHFTIGGTENDDTIVSGGGDDAIWGRGGNDRIEAGYGVDKVFAGDGDDIITNAGTDIGEADFLHGNEGNDVIHGGSGLSLIFGNQGTDFLIAGPDGKELFGGTGGDFLLGGTGGDFLLGNEGDDWIEGGQRFDTLSGENSELFFNSTIIGHDVLNGGSGDTDYDAESGDDIMFQNDEGIQRSNGMAGFDWAIHKGDSQAANSDLGIPIFETQEAFILRDRFDLVEGLSGWIHDDTLTGRKTAVNTRAEIEGTAAIPGPNSTLDSYSNDLLKKNVALINGLDALVAHLGDGIPVTKVVNGQTIPVLDENGVQERVIFSTADASDILLGGGGSDIIKGLAGDDIIDGDRWLNVRISVRANADGTGPELFSVDSMTEIADRMLSGELNPGQLTIVREILDGDVDNIEEDIAVFTDVRANYTITRNADGSITVDHTGFDDTTPDGGTDDDNGEGDLPKPLSDGTDRLFNIEVLRFADGDVRFTPPELNLVGPENGQYLDNFNNDSFGNSNGSTNWGPDWVEANDSGGVTSGQIRIDDGNNVMQFIGGNGNNYNGAQITRAVDLTGATTASLTYSVQENGLDANDDTLTVLFSRDGSEANFVQIDLINSTTNGAIRNFDLTSYGPFTANAAIRFVASSMESGDSVNIDNVAINFTKPAVVNYETTFTEGGNEVDIADAPRIVEDSGEIYSARIVLTNAQAGDQLEVPNNLPGDIDSDVDTSVPGQITVILTGVESLAAYQAAIQAIEFSNSSQDPSTLDRIITVTVNDGLSDSNIATTTVNVVAVDDPTNANNDSVITNISGTTNIVIPEWALLANDTDVDSELDITAVSGANSLSNLSLLTNPGSITFTDPTTGQSGGSFTYTAMGDTDTDAATVSVTRDTTATVDGTTGDNILVGSSGASTFDGGTGDDIVLAGDGGDTIVWNANGNGATDGHDFVDGGAGTDTFDINTRAGTTESYRVYTVAAALNGANAIAGLTAADLKPGTEIIITRTTGGGAVSADSIIAELDNVEEIRIGNQTSDPSNGSAGNGDSVAIFGDFTTTSLALNTITIDGNAGDDTIDISSLGSAHRIVFRSNGGNDTIIGTLRPQDVIELFPGTTAEDYEISVNEDGSKTISADGRSVTYFGDASFEDDTNDDDVPGSGDDEDDDDDDVVTPPSSGATRTGTAQADVLTGSEGDDNIVAFAGDDVVMGNGGADAISLADGDDFVTGGDGRDVIFAGAGNDQVFGGTEADTIFGDAGADRIFGDAGNDMINGGVDNDTVFGGDGDDLIVAEVGDGNDVYYGDAGNDTLDMSAATVNVTVNLGSGALANGSASSSQTGNDTLWGIENVYTGSGNDTITASNTVNVISGGVGNDTFRFVSTTGADGDTIVGFEPGDRLDLSSIDANQSVAGDQGFTLVSSGVLTAAGQLAVSFGSDAHGDFTLVKGNVDGNADADFTIQIEGHHNLTNSNLTS